VDYEIELLKRIPKEHYTLHEGKMVKVEVLLKKLLKKNRRAYKSSS
jgi:hypothetical protein